ncbi:DUF2283 domain-containing protein [Candidatus Woesearchaeota archaeon]|nr:DUF2283 domain-containing protein [Candidatus Woesearchaeota archaeon]
MKKTVYYEAEDDILFVHNGYSDDEKFKGNIDIGDFILDISNKGKIKGIEVLNASEVLKQYGLTREVLVGLKDAILLVRMYKKAIHLSINFIFDEKEIPALVTVPLEEAIA